MNFLMTPHRWYGVMTIQIVPEDRLRATNILRLLRQIACNFFGRSKMKNQIDLAISAKKSRDVGFS